MFLKSCTKCSHSSVVSPNHTFVLNIRTFSTNNSSGTFRPLRLILLLQLAHYTQLSTKHVAPPVVSTNHVAAPVVSTNQRAAILSRDPALWISLSVYIIWLHFLKITLPLPQPGIHVGITWLPDHQSQGWIVITWSPWLQHGVTLATARGLVCYLFQLPGSGRGNKTDNQPITQQATRRLARLPTNSCSSRALSTKNRGSAGSITVQSEHGFQVTCCRSANHSAAVAASVLVYVFVEKPRSVHTDG